MNSPNCELGSSHFSCKVFIIALANSKAKSSGFFDASIAAFILLVTCSPSSVYVDNGSM